MKIYTKTGDAGTTSLVGGKRISKDNSRVEAYGTIDELMAQVSYLRDSLEGDAFVQIRDDLMRSLQALMNAAAILATDGQPSVVISQNEVAYLEKRIDEIQSELEPIRNFTIPSGHVLVSLANIARTVCRRAERRIISAGADVVVSQYVNRLSDYLYVVGREISQEFNVEEVIWVGK